MKAAGVLFHCILMFSLYCLVLVCAYQRIEACLTLYRHVSYTLDNDWSFYMFLYWFRK